MSKTFSKTTEENEPLQVGLDMEQDDAFRLSLQFNWPKSGNTSLKDDVTSITVTLTHDDESNKKSWSWTGNLTDEVWTSNPTTGEIDSVTPIFTRVLNDNMRDVTIAGLPKNGTYLPELSYTDNNGLDGEMSFGSIDFNSSPYDKLVGTDISLTGLTNKLNNPSLTLVKEIVGDSLKDKTFEFKIQFSNKDGKPIEFSDETGKRVQSIKISLPEAGESFITDEKTGKPFVKTPITIPSGVKAGDTFTITELKDPNDKWTTSSTVVNAKKDGEFSEGETKTTGTLCWSENIVTFKNSQGAVEIPVKKILNIIGAKPESIPDFEFELTLLNKDSSGSEPFGVKMPANTKLTVKGDKFATGTEASSTFDAITFTSADTYTFTVKETSVPTDKNWTYDTTAKTITVVVNAALEIENINGEKPEEFKGVEFTNTYKAVGSLKISKEVTGTDGDKAKAFQFKVTLKDANGNPLTPANTPSITVEATTENTDGAAQPNITDCVISGKPITLAHKQSATINGLPAGTLYEVSEVDADGYQVTVNGASTLMNGTINGVITANDIINVEFVNHKDTPDNPPPPDTPDKPTPPGGGGGKVKHPDPTPTIPEPDVPQVYYPGETPDPNDPDSPEEITIMEDDVPQTYIKTWDPENEEYVYIPEEPTPLAPITPTPFARLDTTPKTDDPNHPWFWLGLCFASILGIGLLKPCKNKEDE